MQGYTLPLPIPIQRTRAMNTEQPKTRFALAVSSVQRVIQALSDTRLIAGVLIVLNGATIVFSEPTGIVAIMEARLGVDSFLNGSLWIIGGCLVLRYPLHGAAAFLATSAIFAYCITGIIFAFIDPGSISLRGAGITLLLYVLLLNAINRGFEE